MNKIVLQSLSIFALCIVVSCLKPSNYPYPNPKPPKTYTHGPNEKPDYELINRLVDNAEFVFEGKAVSSQSFYGYVDGHKGIYTCFVLEVYKVFKGDTKAHKVEICTEGGVIYDKETNYGVFSHCDDCNYGDGTNIGEVGIVFAHASEIVNPGSKVKIENRFNLDYCISINKWASSYESAKGRFYDVNYFLYQPFL